MYRLRPVSNTGVAAEWITLGEVAATVNGRHVALSRQSRRILGLLLQEPGRPVPGDRLIPTTTESTAEQVANSARVAVSRLRSALARAGLRHVVTTSARGYHVDIDPGTVDHVLFDNGVRDAGIASSPSVALRSLEAALTLWRGDPFGEFGDEMEFRDASLALGELHRSAVDRWCTLVVDVEHGAALISRLESAVAEEPLREQRWAAMMLAQYRSGNQSAAVRSYDRARGALRDQLGLEPGPELQRLFHDILEHDARLEWRPDPRAAQVTGLEGLVRPSTLVGRDAETSDLLELLARNRVVVLTGYGGMGKTALAAEVASRFPGPAWIVPLGGITEPTRIDVAVASAMGLSDQTDSLGRVARILTDSEGLLLLDNCEHLADASASFVTRLSAAASRIRVLLTSRVELDIRGAFTFVVPPLPFGSKDAPGPAALIAADAALIRPSHIAQNWLMLETICRRADGVPLALELLGAASTDAGLATTPAGTTSLDTAVGVALESLPIESRHLVDVLRVLPGEVGIEYLAPLIDMEAQATRRALGSVIRAGMAIQRVTPSGTRVRLLEPVRDALPVAEPLETRIVGDLARVFSDLTERAAPSLIAAVDTDWVLVVDDEHELGLWLLNRLGSCDRLELALRLVAVWRTCSRHVDARRILEDLEAVASEAPDLDRARYWAARAYMSPSFADRVPLVERLQDAVRIAEAADDTALAARATADLAVGLGWSGDLASALALIDQLLASLSEEQHWARATLETLVAMSRGMLGEPVQAADDLIRLSEEYRDIGHVGEVANNLYVAAGFARLAGDDEMLDRILERAESLPVDRFSAYPMACLAFERARTALTKDRSKAGPLLWEAYRLLETHGEQRTAAICRRELGTWRLDQGDADGVLDLATACLHLIDADPRHGAVALASIVSSSSSIGESDRAVLAAAVPALATTTTGAPLDDRELERLGSFLGRDQPTGVDTAALRGVLHRVVIDARP